MRDWLTKTGEFVKKMKWQERIESFRRHLVFLLWIRLSSIYLFTAVAQQPKIRDRGRGLTAEHVSGNRGISCCCWIGNVYRDAMRDWLLVGRSPSIGRADLLVLVVHSNTINLFCTPPELEIHSDCRRRSAHSFLRERNQRDFSFRPAVVAIDSALSPPQFGSSIPILFNCTAATRSRSHEPTSGWGEGNLRFLMDGGGGATIDPATPWKSLEILAS